MCPLPENASHNLNAPATGQEFSAEERALLLRLAHESIAAAVKHNEISLTPPSPHLAEARGVFTTLYSGGGLRGCVGYALPITPLYRAVAETARAAAFGDMRFEPVSGDELARLQISLSVLSPLRPLPAQEVEVGRHGLLISLGGLRGLLLPQVAVEHSWERITFLEQTCRKGGLPADAWRSGATIEAFTAEVFGDEIG